MSMPRPSLQQCPCSLKPEVETEGALLLGGGIEGPWPGGGGCGAAANRSGGRTTSSSWAVGGSPSPDAIGSALPIDVGPSVLTPGRSGAVKKVGLPSDIGLVG